MVNSGYTKRFYMAGDGQNHKLAEITNALEDCVCIFWLPTAVETRIKYLLLWIGFS